MIRRALFSMLLLLNGHWVMADQVALNPDHPMQYTVVKGDTLWDISKRFLQSPWQWPTVFANNPTIKNPDLIYPGDTLSLIELNGQTKISLTRGLVVEKRSPKVRETLIQKGIKTIPLSLIKPFLQSARIVAEERLASAPYIVAHSDNRLLSVEGDKVYVEALNDPNIKHYHVFRKGAEYKDENTGERLGFISNYVAEAWLSERTTPALFELESSEREVRVGDRLLAVIDEQDGQMQFLPNWPTDNITGQIISVSDEALYGSQYQVIVINKGQRDGLAAGHLLSAYQAEQQIIDKVKSQEAAQSYFGSGKNKKHYVTLPKSPSGVVMVFKAYEKISYALVMSSSRSLHLNDQVISTE